jgi:hypothetical protein
MAKDEKHHGTVLVDTIIIIEFWRISAGKTFGEHCSIPASAV